MEKITSRRNPVCIHIKKLGANRAYREEQNEFLCDGIKLLEEAVKSGAAVTSVLTSSHLPFPLPVDTRVYFTDRSVIDSLSPLKNAQSTLFTVKMPPSGGFDCENGVSILLDGIQDPGNVGAIIRTANAFGIKSVILTGECADRYNPKTVRASMGAIFRQNIIVMSIHELNELRFSGVRFIGTTPGESKTVFSEINLKNALIAIGSEGQGLSGEVMALCEQRISIPISTACESLNAAVAAAIIMWEANGRSGVLA